MDSSQVGTAPQRAFRIIGADDRPIDIPAGEFYFNPKARARRMMRNNLSSEARQVYACLELATMGFQQELAVTMERGTTRPLAPCDISEQTGLNSRDTRRALVELEEQGLAERRGADDPKVLQKGKVRIYSWAVPRVPNKVNPGGSAQPTFPGWFPESWAPLKPFLTRIRAKISIDEEAARDLLSDGEEAARAYQSGWEAATRFAERICAQDTHNKEERTEIYEEKEPPPPQFVKPEPVVESSLKAEEEEAASKNNQEPQTPVPNADKPTFEKFAAEYPPDHLDDGKAEMRWYALSMEEKDHAIAWLKLNRDCPRWSADDGRWIPLASTFLREKQFQRRPPPAIARKGKDHDGLAPIDEVVEMMRKHRKGSS